MLDGLVGAFGPFLIPATVFAIGVVGYALLHVLFRRIGDGSAP